jgi:hypothetical protein
LANMLTDLNRCVCFLSALPLDFNFPRQTQAGRLKPASGSFA